MRAAGLFALFALILIAVSGRTEACSCRVEGGAEDVQIQREFEQAVAVFTARITSIEQNPQSDSSQYILEDADFVVLEVLKGDVRPGQRIEVRSHLGPGPCGRSAQNDPVWLEDETGPVAISKEWLIYGHEQEPYELSLCDRSMPLSHRGSSDLAHLRKVFGRRGEMAYDNRMESAHSRRSASRK